MMKESREPKEPLGTIDGEQAACLAAFEGIGIGAPVWHCHHGEGVEIPTGTAMATTDIFGRKRYA